MIFYDGVTHTFLAATAASWRLFNSGLFLLVVHDVARAAPALKTPMKPPVGVVLATSDGSGGGVVLEWTWKILM